MEQPKNVARFLHALGKPAKELRQDEARHAHAMDRTLRLIGDPWAYKDGAVDESREVMFLREMFNRFHECMQSCETLDVMRVLVRQTLQTTPDESQSTVITFWNESYLNEVYIFRLRIFDFLTYIERRYKKDRDFAEIVGGVCAELRQFTDKQLGEVITTRGAHVHERQHRHADPELGRLYMLFTCIEALGMKELIPEREKALIEARDWLFTQIDHFGELCWKIFDAVCEVLAEGIITENDWVIVPMPYKNNPEAFRAQGGEGG